MLPFSELEVQDIVLHQRKKHRADKNFFFQLKEDV